MPIPQSMHKPMPEISSSSDWNSPWFAFETLVVQGLVFLRAEFRVPEGRSVRRASLSVAATAWALGNLTHSMNLYHPKINGQPVHREAMNPGQLSPRRGRALYRSWGRVVQTVRASLSLFIRLMVRVEGMAALPQRF